MKIAKRNYLCVAALSAITLIAVLLRPPCFYLNDDVTMRSILSGAYTGTPNGHAVYMQYPLTGILALLYRITGFIPWMELFFTICLVTCMVLIAGQWKQPVTGCLVALSLMVPLCLYMHYTLVAAAVAGTAVFLLAMRKRNAWPIVLIVLAYMIRSQIGLLCLPFAACAMVWQVIETPKGEWKKEIISKLKYSTVILGGIIICFTINGFFYSAPEWKNYLDYNESRTLLYDYTDFLSTDEYAENYDSYGMTKEEYQILSSYNTMLDADIDETKMEKVAETVSAGMKQDTNFIETLKDCILKYYTQIRYSDLPYNYIWIVLYLLLGAGFAAFGKWRQLLVWGILGAGRSSIWMYLIWKGRFPERVSLSLYVMELLLLLGMSLVIIRNSAWFKGRVEKIATVVFLLCLVWFFGYQWKETTEKVEYQAGIQSEWNVLNHYCEENPEKLYLVDVFSAVEYSGMQYEEDAENIMLLGGWMSASPLAKERLAKIDAKDAAEALFYQENVSLIVEKGMDISWLEEYLQNRFGECALEAVAEISNREPKIFVEYQVR